MKMAYQITIFTPIFLFANSKKSDTLINLKYNEMYPLHVGIESKLCHYNVKQACFPPTFSQKFMNKEIYLKVPKTVFIKPFFQHRYFLNNKNGQVSSLLLSSLTAESFFKHLRSRPSRNFSFNFFSFQVTCPKNRVKMTKKKNLKRKIGPKEQ